MRRLPLPQVWWRRGASSFPKREESLPSPGRRVQLVRPTVTRWKRPPFLKGLFAGKCDTELLSFPEILNKEELAQLEEHVAALAHVMQHAQGGDGSAVDVGGAIPAEPALREMGLFGRTLPPQYGGLDATHTASARLGEALGLDWGVGAALTAHEFLATQVLVQFGSEAQKSLYLPRLASGELVAALCCTEHECGSDFLSVGATAREDEGGCWVLSGCKSWVANARRAGLFVVIARTPQQQQAGGSGGPSVFLVESGAEGVKVRPQDTNGLHALATGIVHFDEVSIPPSNVVGSLGNGSQVYLKALESFRIASSSITLGALKSLYGSVVGSVTGRERGGRSLADYEAVRVGLSRVQSCVYGMESAAYFTAAILDSTEEPDVALEAAALKVLVSEGTAFCLESLSALLGASSLAPPSHIERMRRDARALHLIDGPLDVCRLFLGLSGCKEVGRRKLEAITHARNPFYYPKEVTLRALRHWKIRRGKYAFDQDIAGHLHPSLTEWGNELERKVQLLEVAVEECLREHGRNIVQLQLDPLRLASVGAELYAWVAVLARSSRSYCIGLPNAHHEVRLAATYCGDANRRVEVIFEQLFRGFVENNDKNHLLLGEQSVDVQGYFPAHPLTHNF